MQPPSFGQAQPREKKKLSLVDPNTGKPIDLGGGEQTLGDFYSRNSSSQAHMLEVIAESALED